jgi:phosphohistidine swiveling domain-containing protein
MKTQEQTERVGRFTMPLDSIRLKDLPRVGGKAAHLGELVAAGLPVPSGFVVPTGACERFLQSDPGLTGWLESLAKGDSPDPSARRATVEKIREKLDKIPVPDHVTSAIRADLAEASNTAWAVRSSATVEDLPEASFAGQHDSFLNERGGDAVIAAVKRCWLSLFSERAVSYRMQKGIAAGRAQMAVIVQRFIPANAAGVMFTANPAGGNSDSIVIEAAFGLGEAVVQGKVTPDCVEVSRSRLKIVRRKTGLKRMQVLAGENGVREELLPAGKTNSPVLDDGSAARLAELGLKVEVLFGAPQDIEWAQLDGKLFLLQSRPLTGKDRVKTKEDRQVWSNLNTGEVAPDVMAPITWSLWQALWKGVVLRSTARLLGVDARRAPLVGLVAGRLYFNVNTIMAALQPFSFLLKGAAILFQAVGGGPAAAYRRALAIPPADLPDLGFGWSKYILSWPRILFDLITHLPGRGEPWMARFRARTDELVRRDVEAMPTPQLIHFCVRLIQEPLKGVDLLYLAVPAAVLPVLHKACHNWLGELQPAPGYRLFSALSGMPTAEAGLALWRLAVLAHADPDTEAAVGSESEWPQICAKLRLTENGRKFLAAWDAFMVEHGHHCRGELELFNARWSETPEYVLDVVQGCLRSIGQSDPLEHQRQLAGERERLTEQCLRRLKNPIKRWIFSRSLRRAQKLAVFREVLKSQAVRRFAFARRVLLILGQRLHLQGILSDRDDLFFLELGEIEPVATGGASLNWRERIETRRREYEINLELSPPPLVIGTFDPAAPTPPVPSADAKLLEGVPASPGVATGPARVILRANNHERVLPGEILVAPFTDPAWSPYFLTSAGLVVEQGGILSHGSIIAREYGLPTVVNVVAVTQIIRTGDVVQVDGNNGRVNILVRGPISSSEKVPTWESVK